MVTITRRTRVYISGELLEVDVFEYEMPIARKQQVDALLSQGFVAMDPSLYTKVCDIDKKTRHIVTVKIQDGARLGGNPRVTNAKYRGASASY